jgi:hypothetical protein
MVLAISILPRAAPALDVESRQTPEPMVATVASADSHAQADQQGFREAVRLGSGHVSGTARRADEFFPGGPVLNRRARDVERWRGGGLFHGSAFSQDLLQLEFGE